MVDLYYTSMGGGNKVKFRKVNWEKVKRKGKHINWGEKKP